MDEKEQLAYNLNPETATAEQLYFIYTALILQYCQVTHPGPLQQRELGLPQRQPGGQQAPALYERDRGEDQVMEASDWPRLTILTSDWFRNMSGSAGADTSA